MPNDGRLNTLFYDLNAYFASCEQHLRPELRGKPIAVSPLGGIDSSCCITSSYEARASGVRTGINVGHARKLCPEITIVRARPRTYVELHHQILAAIDTVVPVDAVHSIDELSIKLLREERETKNAIEIAKAIKRAVAERVGPTFTSSIGIAPNRLLAKLAGDMHKPDGLTIIEREELPNRLHGLSLTDFPGIGDAMERRLIGAGITTVERMCSRTPTQMREAWGSIVGIRWWHYLRGDEIDELRTIKRNIGHQHVLPPECRTKDKARGVLIRLTMKAAARARDEGYHARQLTVRATMLNGPKFKQRAAFGETRDSRRLVELAESIWAQVATHARPIQVGVVLHELVPDGSATLPLFEQDARHRKLSDVIDRANKRYGVNAIYTASMQSARDTAPRRISFGSVPDLGIPDVDE